MKIAGNEPEKRNPLVEWFGQKRNRIAAISGICGLALVVFGVAFGLNWTKSHGPMAQNDEQNVQYGEGLNEENAMVKSASDLQMVAEKAGVPITLDESLIAAFDPISEELSWRATLKADDVDLYMRIQEDVFKAVFGE